MGLIIGTILSVGFDAGATPISGFLQCNGSAVDRIIYAELFNIIGTRWGAGDGTHTFNLPDLRGAFIRGVSDGTDADPDADSRQHIAPGGSTGDHVGSVEFYATALPLFRKTINFREWQASSSCSSAGNRFCMVSDRGGTLCSME